ncbi:MAG: hypothetical protein JO166_16335 [Deltaproteobacteria bacterium]|nr:hypothetical protein [Deltaproteobacteria bacterium]
MATEWIPTNYGSPRQSLGGLPSTPLASPQKSEVENLIRRELKIDDASDPGQVAQALLARYQDQPRARAISQEAQGLPFLQAMPVAAPVMPAPTSSENELALATADVEKGIRDLTTNPLLKDITPELLGWGDAVRMAITEGASAARMALDARQRDKAMAMRRTLGDYARMARLVGALTPGMNQNYRAFAQSLDEAAAVILVITGDALSSVGLSRGEFLLQAPYAELQTRRDAAIYALRNLLGATQQAYSQEDWPRGIESYRRLFNELEAQGQGALRSLLVERELARTMDALIQRAANGSADGLRALGSTALLDLEQFRRLVIIGQRAVTPPEPPLTAFLDALLLFVQAFDSAGGFRLVRVARPPILFYGLYGNTFTPGDNALLRLIMQRGLLADRLDCLLACNCDDATVQLQLILDKILYDVDRAIDLYALGRSDFGAPERRAAAYSFLVDYVLQQFVPANFPHVRVPPPEALAALPDFSRFQYLARWEHLPAAVSVALEPLTSVQDILRPSLIQRTQRDRQPAFQWTSTEIGMVFKHLISVASATERLLSHNDLTQKLSDLRSRVPTSLDPIGNAGSNPPPLTIVDLTNVYAILESEEVSSIRAARRIPLPKEVNASLGIIAQELFIQRASEERWRQLVETMAADCISSTTVFQTVQLAIEGSIQMCFGREYEDGRITIPAQFETSLEALVTNRDYWSRR